MFPYFSLLDVTAPRMLQVVVEMDFSMCQELKELLTLMGIPEVLNCGMMGTPPSFWEFNEGLIVLEV